MLYPPVTALITLHAPINFQHTQEVQALSALLLVLYKFPPLNREPRLGSSATTCFFCRKTSRSRSRHIAESKVQRTIGQSGLVLPSRRRFVFTYDIILAHMDLLTVCVRTKT